MPKDEIYKKAKTWVVTTLKSGDNMVELEGSNSDQIVGTGNIAFPEEAIKQFRNESLNFKFIVKCKDNRLKYSVENFTLYLNVASRSSLEKVNDYSGSIGKRKQEVFETEVKTASKKIIEELIQDFIMFMKSEQNEDW